MCPSAPRVCSEPGGQRPVLSLSLDLIGGDLSHRQAKKAQNKANVDFKIKFDLVSQGQSLRKQ